MKRSSIAFPDIANTSMQASVRPCMPATYSVSR
jgi:hypothetical protein